MRALLAAASAVAVLAACSDEPASAERDAGKDGSVSTAGTDATPEPSSDPVQFRLVEFSDLNPPTSEVPRPGPASKRFERLECGADPLPVVSTPAEEPIVACSLPTEETGDGDGAPAIKYALGPALIVGGVVEAEASVPEGQTAWIVALQLDSESAEEFARVSRELVGTQQQFAIVLDGTVLSAPTVQGVVPNGKLQITGNFDAESATSLADRLVATSD